MSREPSFVIERPAGHESSVVVEIPHAGLSVPRALESSIRVPREIVLRDSDLYVDRLFNEAPAMGATLLAARLSRYVVDLNRAPDDVDLETVPDHPAPRPTQSRGVVWRITTDGRPAIREPLRYRELLARLEEFHSPYHRALREILDAKRSAFGGAILIAAHSMPSTSRDGAQRRADIVPGTRGRTTAHARVIELVERHFRAAGLSVRHDDPYRGGYTTGHYGDPAANVHAVQIEVNRGLYVDERTSMPKEPELAWVRSLMSRLVERLSEINVRELR